MREKSSGRRRGGEGRLKATRTLSQPDHRSLSRLTPLCPVAASWSLAAALPGRAAAAYVLVARRRPGDSPILVTDLLPPPRAKEEAREGIGGGRRDGSGIG